MELGSSQKLLQTVGRDAWQEQPEATENRAAHPHLLPLPGSVPVTSSSPVHPLLNAHETDAHGAKWAKRVSLPAPYPPWYLSSSQQDLSMSYLDKSLQGLPPACPIKAPLSASTHQTKSDFPGALSGCRLLPTPTPAPHVTLHSPVLPGTHAGPPQASLRQPECASSHGNLSLPGRLLFILKTSFKGRPETFSYFTR